MLKLSAIESGDIGEYWEFVDAFYHKKFYSPDYPEKLANFLKKLGGKNILDSACGIGFPALTLPTYGIQPDCSDGSESMINLCKKRAKEQGLNLNIFHSRWENLPKTTTKLYDIALCLDSAITHVDTWGDKREIVVREVRESILRSISGLYKILNTGGKVVIGLGKYAFDKLPEYEVVFDPIIIEEKEVSHI